MEVNMLLFNIIFYIVLFMLVFIFCYFFAARIKPKKVKGKANGKTGYKMMNEVKFLIQRYNLDDKKINLKRLDVGVCLCNAFIISTASTIICNINIDMFFKLLIGFVLIFALIYAVFELYGRYLNKRFGKYNDRKEEK
jgi:hypothetical protein